MPYKAKLYISGLKENWIVGIFRAVYMEMYICCYIQDLYWIAEFYLSNSKLFTLDIILVYHSEVYLFL